jgi:hypothetical protein
MRKKKIEKRKKAENKKFQIHKVKIIFLKQHRNN